MLDAATETNILESPSDPDDPMLEPVLGRGPRENGDATPQREK